MKKSSLSFFNFFSKIIKYALILFIALFFLLILSLINTYKNFKDAALNALSGRDDITIAVNAVKNRNWEEALQQNFKTLVSGVERVEKQLVDILKTHGLIRFTTIGQLYDPHRHEVVGHIAEEGPEDRIVDELEPGYMFHDRLLRAAKVRIRVSPQPPKIEKQEEIT